LSIILFSASIHTFAKDSEVMGLPEASIFFTSWSPTDRSNSAPPYISRFRTLFVSRMRYKSKWRQGLVRRHSGLRELLNDRVPLREVVHVFGITTDLNLLSDDD
jgi:hypothetical protein